MWPCALAMLFDERGDPKCFLPFVCRAEALNELRLLASLRHPNLVQYNEAFVEVGWVAGAAAC